MDKNSFGFVMSKQTYLNINQATWDSRVDEHLSSAFYDMPSFLAGRNSLNSIESELLGDVSGLSIAHLQCHFGQDTLSLARLGANVTGVDFSPVAIARAQQISERLNIHANFVCSDILQLELEETFDIVFASYGILGWHPNVEKWFTKAAELLTPAGRLIMVDFHPMVWMFDAAFSSWQHSYFNRGEIIEQNESYVSTNEHKDSNSSAANPTSEIGWNHSLADIIGAGLANELTLTYFAEHDYSPYPCFPNMIETEQGYQLREFAGQIPMLYSLVFTQKP